MHRTAQGKYERKFGAQFCLALFCAFAAYHFPEPDERSRWYHQSSGIHAHVTSIVLTGQWH